MNALKKLITLLFAMCSTTAFAITDVQVFAYAEANYPSLFAGAPAAGQYLQYNYRYYPGSGNYLAVDTNGEIFILGPYSGNVITSVGMVSAYASYITAWEATQPVNVTSIVGGWYGINLGEAQSALVFTFTSNGKYYLAEDGNPATDPNGQDGMEYGTYSWNPTTGALTHSTTFDTNGEWGLSHSTVISSITTSGDTLLITFTDETITLARVIDANSTIVGSWYMATGGQGNRIFTFLSDGTYLSSANEDPAVDPAGQRGMERGTYTWNAATGAFTHTTTVDTDGEWGLSHGGGCTNMQVSGNTLTGTCTESGQVIYLTFTRITN